MRRPLRQSAPVSARYRGWRAASMLLMPHILLADLDGTLITAPDGPGGDVEELARLMAVTGGALVPVSARPIANIARMFLGHDTVSLAVGSGGGVVARISAGRVAEIVHEETLDLGKGRLLLDAFIALQDDGVGMTLVFQDSRSAFEVLISRGDRGLSQRDLQEIIGDRPMRQVAERDIIAMPQSMHPLGASFLAHADPEVVAQLLPKALLPSGWRSSVYPEVRVPGWSWFEAFPESANKGRGGKRVIEAWSAEFGTPPTVIAVGDSADDVGMFRVAKRSYCPATAAREARRAASRILPEPGGAKFAAAVAALLRHDISESRRA